MPDLRPYFTSTTVYKNCVPIDFQLPASGSSGSVGPGPTDPLTIVSSVSPVFFLSADMGITIGALGVSAWADQSGNNRDFTQAASGSQPAWAAAGINARGTITFDGVNDVLGSSYIPPSPSVSPSWYWMVFRPIAIVNGRIFAASSGRQALACSTANRIYEANLSVTNLVTTTTAWQRVEYSFTNSTADYVKAGASSVTGANAGNTSAAIGMWVGGSNATPASPANFELACFGAWVGQPTPSEIAALDQWVTNYYGATVQV